jgi:sporulation-control protein spo0M
MRLTVGGGQNDKLAVMVEVARQAHAAGGSLDPLLAPAEGALRFRKRKSRAYDRASHAHAHMTGGSSLTHCPAHPQRQ